MTFRALDTESFTPAALADQPAPTLLWVPLAELVIDERYQRELTRPGRRLIQRIADGWDWTKYQPILIAATPDGRHAVVDGQHRAHAAAVVGLEALPAMVVPMTPAQQAAAFTAVNSDRVRLDRSATYRAQLAAGDPVALAAEAAVAAAGCRLMTTIPTAAKRSPGEVYTHALILRMVAQGEAAAVTAGLQAIRASEVGGERNDSYGYALRVYDQKTLICWLPVLATNQLFLTLPLADLFDTIDWDEEYDRAAGWSRRDGRPVRGYVVERVTALLRAALDTTREAA